MADSKVTALTADTSVDSADLGYTIEDPGGTPISKKATWLNILKGAFLGLLTADNDVAARIGGAMTRVPVAASRIMGRKASGDYTALTGAEAGDIISPAWTSYTPTLTQSGAVTKTVDRAKYVQIGKIVHVSVFLTVTGTGTANNGITITLPVTGVAGSGSSLGVGRVYDASANLIYRGITVATSTSVVEIQAPGSTVGGGLGTTATPFTAALASSDVVEFSATYEAA